MMGVLTHDVRCAVCVCVCVLVAPARRGNMVSGHTDGHKSGNISNEHSDALGRGSSSSIRSLSTCNRIYMYIRAEYIKEQFGNHHQRRTLIQ